MIIIAIDECTEELNEAIRDIRGEVKVVQYNMFQRDGFNEPLRAFSFTSPFEYKPQIKCTYEPVRREIIPTQYSPAKNKNDQLPEGLRIYNVYKGLRFEAEVIENGQIKFDGNVYNSPSWAAVAAIQSTGSSRATENGWRWWKFIDKQTGLEKPIDAFRQ